MAHKSGSHIDDKLARAMLDCGMAAGERPLRPSSHPA